MNEKAFEESRVMWSEVLRMGKHGEEWMRLMEGGEAMLLEPGWLMVMFPIGDWLKVRDMGGMPEVTALVRNLKESSGVRRLTVRVKDDEGIWPVVSWVMEEGSLDWIFTEWPHLREVVREMPGKLDTQEEVDGYFAELWRACNGPLEERRQMQGFDTHDRKWKDMGSYQAMGMLAYRPRNFSLMRVKPDDRDCEKFPN
jgi:hypothetical protein